MIGVPECFLGDVPGLLPGEALFISQQAHEFRDADGGMSVVELRCPFFVEVAQVRILQLVQTDHIL